jgi:hypothetical protein
VEAVQPYIIPTLSKSKISHHLSYPVGAAAVSIALASVAQLPEVKLHFYFWSDNSLRRGHTNFLEWSILTTLCPQQQIGRFGSSTAVRLNTVGKSLCRQSRVLIATE